MLVEPPESAGIPHGGRAQDARRDAICNEACLPFAPGAGSRARGDQRERLPAKPYIGMKS